MRLLVSGATATLAKYGARHGDVLGCLPVPRAANDPAKLAALGLPIAADNGAFNGFEPLPFVRMLTAFMEAGVKLEWVACPDVVADAVATWRLWHRWEGIIRAFGFRPAMVLQDGMDAMGVSDFDPPVVFVGGTTGYKLGHDARRIVAWARKKNRPAHMGRVNTQRRIEYAVQIGCTSCDGSGFSKWPDTRIPMGIRWIRQAMHPTFTEATRC